MSHTWSSLTARYGQPVLCAQPTGEFPEELYAFGTVPREFAVFHVPEDRREMLPAGVIVFARRDTDSWMPDPASKLFAIKHLLALNEGLQAQLDVAGADLYKARALANASLGIASHVQEILRIDAQVAKCTEDTERVLLRDGQEILRRKLVELMSNLGDPADHAECCEWTRGATAGDWTTGCGSSWPLPENSTPYGSDIAFCFCCGRLVAENSPVTARRVRTPRRGKER